MCFENISPLKHHAIVFQLFDVAVKSFHFDDQKYFENIKKTYMPFLTSSEVTYYKLIVDFPADRWCYLYDTMTETLLYVGNPISPAFIEYEW